VQTDTIKWNMRATVIKYDPGSVERITRMLGHEPTGPDLRRLESLALIEPDDVVDVIGNAVLDAGKQRLGDLITGTGSPVAFSATRGVTGVGNGTTGNTSGMTALQGASQFYKGLDGAPSSLTGVISASATFTAAEGNFAWEEWCWAIATAAPVASSSFSTATTSGVIINRKVQSLGTKANGAVWTLAAQVSLS